MKGPHLAGMLAGAAMFALVQGCATTTPDTDDDFAISQASLVRGEDPYTMRAIEVLDLAAGGAELANIASPMAHIAEVGGNAVAINLPGLNADGTEIDPVALSNVIAIAERAKAQHMSLLICVLGNVAADPVVRMNAVKTAARALKNEKRVVYWIDGPEAGALTIAFKKIAKGLVVASPENGDLKDVSAEGDAPALSLLNGAIPTQNIETANFVIRGTEADYPALDAALTTPEEKAGWTPDNSVLSQQERDEGFVSLFNAKDLSGWWVFGNKPGFKVSEAGCIERDGTDGLALMTVNRYGDFVFRAEFNIEQGGNSGIFLRAPRTSRQSRIGMEFQIHGDVSEVNTDDMVGAIYVVVPPTSNASNPPGEWNSVEIMLQGDKLKATLNGVVVQDIDLNDYEELKYRLKKGFIGLQDHDSAVQFRNVRIKPL